VTAKFPGGFDNVGETEEIDVAWAELAAVQSGVDKLLVGVPN
jgi:hypothetical protein